MDLEGKKFGRGNRELGGAHDLINQYRLWPYYEFFCKKALPPSISETRYLHNVVGDTKIRKGEGMELDQLRRNTDTSEKKTCLHPFELDALSEAFRMKETHPVHFSSKGLLTGKPKLENQSGAENRKIRKDKSIDRKGEKHSKQHRLQNQVKDGSCVENNSIRNQLQLKNQQLKNQLDKKRRVGTSNDPSVCKRSNTRQ